MAASLQPPSPLPIRRFVQLQVAKYSSQEPQECGSTRACLGGASQRVDFFVVPLHLPLKFSVKFHEQMPHGKVVTQNRRFSGIKSSYDTGISQRAPLANVLLTIKPRIRIRPIVVAENLL